MKLYSFDNFELFNRIDIEKFEMFGDAQFEGQTFTLHNNVNFYRILVKLWDFV